jgi:hypothetical protein
MAYHFFVFSPTLGRQTRIYNLDFSVGRGGRNHHDDVMLLQTLLRMLYIECTDPGTREFRPPLPDEPDIVVDGWIGPITCRYILHYKNTLRKEGKKLYPDEVMDPFRDNDVLSKSTISKTEYAFGNLVPNTFHADLRSNLKKFEFLLEHPDTDPLLRSALTQTRDDARQYGG